MTLLLASGFRGARKVDLPGQVSVAELAQLLGPGTDELLTSSTPEEVRAVLRADSCLAYTEAGRSASTVWLAAADEGAALALAGDVSSRLLTRHGPASQCWAVHASAPGGERFWLRGPGSWEEVRRRYRPSLASQLDSLVRLTEPLPLGLLILCGPPGSGKRTVATAVAVARAASHPTRWVLDPGEFFEVPGYMHAVSVAACADAPSLVVVPYADEFASFDRGRIHPGAVRLLNLLDGPLGGPSGVTVLLLSDSPAESAHPALLQRGRRPVILDLE